MNTALNLDISHLLGFEDHTSDNDSLVRIDKSASKVDTNSVSVSGLSFEDAYAKQPFSPLVELGIWIGTRMATRGDAVIGG
jgi:hypothetical protein